MTKGITPWLAEKQRGESTHPLDNVLPLDQLFAMCLPCSALTLTSPLSMASSLAYARLLVMAQLI